MSRWYKILAVVGAVITSGYLARADMLDGAMVVARNIATPNVQTNNYPISVNDCFRPMVQMGTGVTGQRTVTLPVSTSFPNGCIIRVKNADIWTAANTGHGMTLSGFPSDLYTILWPQQITEVIASPAGWQTSLNPGRWIYSQANQPTFYVDLSNGNDSNDCLGTTTSACANIQQAVNLACFQTDSTNSIPQVSVANNLNYVQFSLTTHCVGAQCIHVTGDTSNSPPQVLISSNSGMDVYVKDKGCLILSGFSLRASAGAVQGLVCGQNAIVDADHIAFENMPTGNHVVASDNCEINLNSNITITDTASPSSANTFLNASQFGRIQLNTNITATGTFSFSTTCSAFNSGLININSSTITGGTVTATNKFSATTGGGVVGGAANCPGTSTVTTSPGYSN